MSYRDISINDYLPFTTELNKLLCEFAFGDFVIYGTHILDVNISYTIQIVWFVPVKVHQLYTLHNKEHGMPVTPSNQDFVILHEYKAYEYIQLYAHHQCVDDITQCKPFLRYGINDGGSCELKAYIKNHEFNNYFEYYDFTGYRNSDYPMFDIMSDPELNKKYYHVNMELLMCKRENSVVYLGGIKNLSSDNLHELRRAIKAGRVYGCNCDNEDEIQLSLLSNKIYRFTYFTQTNYEEPEEYNCGFRANIINDGSCGRVKMITRVWRYHTENFKLIDGKDFISLGPDVPHSDVNFRKALVKAIVDL
jgi:hypothetical protein